MGCVSLKIFLISLFFCSAISNAAKISSPSRSNVKARTIRQSKKCAVNICFVLDGSGSVSQSEFKNQFYFSADVISFLVDISPIRWAATQYSSKNIPISSFTSDDLEFVQKLKYTKPAGGASAVSDGIAYCEQEFRSFKNDINVMFLFTDGRYNFGVDPLKYIDLVKKEYRHLKVFPVKTGFVNESFFSGFSTVYEVENFLDSLDAELQIETLRSDICKS